jgi:hypothetical protein
VKAAAARKLIGKRVLGTRVYPHDYVDKAVFTVLAVEGNNVRVDYSGYTDWLWLPHWNLVEAES